MIGPIDLVSEMEINAKRMIKKGNNTEADRILTDALNLLNSKEFLDSEIPDLVIIVKKIYNNFMAIGDYDQAFRALQTIYTISKMNINLTNDIKGFLNKLPPDFDVSKYDKELREMSKNNWEINQLLDEMEKLYKKRLNGSL